MKSLAYYDGKIGERENIKIPLCDRSVFFGDAVYDAAVGKNGKVFLCDRHLDRFYNNLKRLEIKAPMPREELCALLSELAHRSEIPEFFLYFQCSRSLYERRHSYVASTKSHLLITVDKFTVMPPKRSLRLISREDMRYRYCDIKTTNLLPAVIASSEAEAMGCDETVFYRGEWVTECAHSNISILKGGVLYTHPTDKFILPGISRERLLSLCRNLSIPFREERFTLSDCYEADEIFVTSTSKLCMAATELDGIEVGGRGGDITERIFEGIYREYTEECGLISD